MKAAFYHWNTSEYVGITGLEPITPSVSEKCSNHWTISLYCCSYRTWTYDLFLVRELFLTTELRSNETVSLTSNCLKRGFKQKLNIMKTWNMCGEWGTWTLNLTLQKSCVSQLHHKPHSREKETRTPDFLLPKQAPWPLGYFPISGEQCTRNIYNCLYTLLSRQAL